MDILPILRALRHRKLGAMLIALQIALTLAIACNSLLIIQTYVRHMKAPSGIDEANIFTMWNTWLGQPNNVEARIKEDVTALRSLPGVIDAEATSNFPLQGSVMDWDWGGWSAKRGQKYFHTASALYFVDEHGLAALGLKLTAGRWFTANEIGEARTGGLDPPSGIIVTEHLANELFPTQIAVGQIVYFTPEEPTQKPTRIVGVVAVANTPYFGYQEQNSSFLPLQFINNGIYYLIRTRAGQQVEVMRSAQAALYALSRQRVIERVKPYIATLRQTTIDERSTSVILAVICGLLLAITAFGIIGLTLYWVGQRRRYIGMRRALGARRLDILIHIHTENLLIAAAGCVLGIALGLAGNVWLLLQVDGLRRMSPTYICIGALIVLALSQAAVLWPALRAASVPPAIASRGL